MSGVTAFTAFLNELVLWSDMVLCSTSENDLSINFSKSLRTTGNWSNITNGGRQSTMRYIVATPPINLVNPPYQIRDRVLVDALSIDEAKELAYRELQKRQSTYALYFMIEGLDPLRELEVVEYHYEIHSASMESLEALGGAIDLSVVARAEKTARKLRTYEKYVAIGGVAFLAFLLLFTAWILFVNANYKYVGSHDQTQTETYGKP